MRPSSGLVLVCVPGVGDSASKNDDLGTREICTTVRFHTKPLPSVSGGHVLVNSRKSKRRNLSSLIHHELNWHSKRRITAHQCSLRVTRTFLLKRIGEIETREPLLSKRLIVKKLQLELKFWWVYAAAEWWTPQKRRKRHHQIIRSQKNKVCYLNVLHYHHLLHHVHGTDAGHLMDGGDAHGAAALPSLERGLRRDN